MSNTNVGGQKLTFDYQEEGTSQGFNKIFYKLIPKGIIEGGELEVVGNTIKIKPFISFFEDNSSTSKVGIRLETTDDVPLTFDANNPYIVGSFIWKNEPDNFMEFKCVNSDAIESDDLIFGKIEYTMTGENTYTITGQDTTMKTWSRSHYENFKDDRYPSFCVTTSTSSSNTVFVHKGSARINCKEVLWEGEYSPQFDMNISTGLKRKDLLVVNDNAQLEIIKGIASAEPTLPRCPNNKLPIAILTIPSLSESGGTIKGGYVDYIYNNNESIVNYTQSPIIINSQDVNYETSEISTGTYVSCKINKNVDGITSYYEGMEIKLLLNTNLITYASKYIYNKPSDFFKFNGVHLQLNNLGYLKIGSFNGYDVAPITPPILSMGIHNSTQRSNFPTNERNSYFIAQQYIVINLICLYDSNFHSYYWQCDPNQTLIDISDSLLNSSNDPNLQWSNYNSYVDFVHCTFKANGDLKQDMHLSNSSINDEVIFSPFFSSIYKYHKMEINDYFRESFDSGQFIFPDKGARQSVFTISGGPIVDTRYASVIYMYFVPQTTVISFTSYANTRY